MENIEEIIDTFNRLSRLVPASPLEAPFAPPVWPRAEMEVMFRLLAEEAGLPQRCPGRACQRARCCKGGPGGGQTCLALWTDADVKRLNTAYLALVLAWMNELKRLCERADMLMPDELAEIDALLQGDDAASAQLRR
ncbi:hypothetical protein [Chelativorans sp. AA-79]|uniref:hypothetical protein n=1 Tax=Chelativorans sp. AA-79 TaxID=3028735 RepID=UPI0023F776C6|nr:hypothetical protein [Chelativorans sp. AA-79]WEX11210.1 hypothetical protein PVE73_09880 [Chelativorans sp. AA-79]